MGKVRDSYSINSRYRKKETSQRRLIIVTLTVSLTIVFVLVFSIYKQDNKNKANEKRVVELEESLNKEKERTAELEKKASDVKSDEYIERIAREKFNLAYPDDIVFVPNAE